jgi:sugar/nucleoside kinase (ribokinase family)
MCDVEVVARGSRVLTIGSVHLDTIALSSGADQFNDGETEVGSITHSVGGSAFNIAANLAMHRRGNDVISSAAVYSILPQHSVLTEIIKYKSAAAGVDTSYLRLYKEFHNKRVRGGGYVGVLDEEKRLTRKAVVDAAMQEADIFAEPEEADTFAGAIEWADILVLDADLAVATVNRIAEHARRHEKPLFMSIGSTQAGTRTWLHSDVSNTAVCLSGRLRVMCEILANLKVDDAEIAAFRRFVENNDVAAAFDINHICGLLKTRYLVCSNVRESKGFALLASGGPPYKCFFATPKDVRTRMQQGNSAGVVDAALAGFIHSYARLARNGHRAADASLVNDKNSGLFKTNILNFVERASESEGATPGSVVSFEEQASEQSRLAKLWRLTKIAFDVLPVFRYVLSIAALIIALWLFELALDVLRYFGYRIEMLDTPWLRMLLRR